MADKILIVEDEQDVVKLLRLILEEKSFEVFDVPSGEEVGDFLDNHRVDAIILDLLLPGIDGYEVCRRLKIRRQTNMVPVIMLTARAFYEDIAKGLSVGADRYITKPFDQMVLVTEIQEQIRKKKEMSRSGVTGDIEIRIASNLKYLEKLNDMTAVLFKSTPFAEKDILNIRYVLTEVGKNAIEWGNLNNSDLPVTFHYITDREKMILQFKDQGSGFNFSRYLDPDYDPTGEYKDRNREGKRSGGLGIMLAKVYMDEIRYNPAGNEVTLIKRFTDESSSF